LVSVEFGTAALHRGRKIIFNPRNRRSESPRLGRVRIGLLIATALLPGLALAADVVGTVFRGNQAAPRVTAVLGDIGTVSDGSGRFVIRNVRPGPYALKCGDAKPVQVQISDGLNQVSCQAQ